MESKIGEHIADDMIAFTDLFPTASDTGEMWMDSVLLPSQRASCELNSLITLQTRTLMISSLILSKGNLVI